MGAWLALGGPSVAITRIVHIGLGTLAAGFVFDLVRRLAPVPVALAAALVQALLLPDALAALTTMSEPLATFLAIVALWCTAVGAERSLTGGLAGNAKDGRMAFLGAGGLLALANLTRPLTLGAAFGLPLTLLIVVYRGAVRPRLWQKALLATFILWAGLAATVAPWLVRQWWVHGVLTLAPESAKVLYAATSPRYGTWSLEVTPLPGAASVRQRYDFYMAGVREHLRDHGAW
jgi:4-amino-4-deoxy-L-arabinose transferase-like glycosyltransferase